MINSAKAGTAETKPFYTLVLTIGKMWERRYRDEGIQGAGRRKEEGRRKEGGRRKG